jgi:hypothetical protein
MSLRGRIGTGEDKNERKGKEKRKMGNKRVKQNRKE